MSEIITRKQYLPQFKAQAIQLGLQQGYPCAKAGQQLGVSHKTLANWVRPRRKQEQSIAIAQGVAIDDPAALRGRIVELEKQLRRAEMERDILKKATAYFAKESL
jgi:transposase